MTPRLREQGSVQLVLDLKRGKKNCVFSSSVYTCPLESCMVAKKLVKCKELLEKKGDGGW